MQRTTAPHSAAALSRWIATSSSRPHKIVRRRVTACFVALTNEQRIAGYYTLASASVLLADLPANIGKKLPRYPSVPTVRMGAFGGRSRLQRARARRELCWLTLLDRACRSEIAAYALVVDAKDESAAAFYQHPGFIDLANAPLTLFLPLSALKSLDA